MQEENNKSQEKEAQVELQAILVYIETNELLLRSFLLPYDAICSFGADIPPLIDPGLNNL